MIGVCLPDSINKGKINLIISNSLIVADGLTATREISPVLINDLTVIQIKIIRCRIKCSVPIQTCRMFHTVMVNRVHETMVNIAQGSSLRATILVAMLITRGISRLIIRINIISKDLATKENNTFREIKEDPILSTCSLIMREIAEGILILEMGDAMIIRMTTMGLLL